jgi:hypothetical protein
MCVLVLVDKETGRVITIPCKQGSDDPDDNIRLQFKEMCNIEETQETQETDKAPLITIHKNTQDGVLAFTMACTPLLFASMQTGGCQMSPHEVEELEAKTVAEFNKNDNCTYTAVGSNNLKNLQGQPLPLCPVAAARSALRQKDAEIAALKEHHAAALGEKIVEITALEEKIVEITALKADLEKAHTDLKNSGDRLANEELMKQKDAEIAALKAEAIQLQGPVNISQNSINAIVAAISTKRPAVKRPAVKLLESEEPTLEEPTSEEPQQKKTPQTINFHKRARATALHMKKQ